jgi:hypothetical protein
MLVGDSVTLDAIVLIGTLITDSIFVVLYAGSVNPSPNVNETNLYTS